MPEIRAKFVRAIFFVNIDELDCFFGYLRPQSLIFQCNFFVFSFQNNELLIESLKPSLEFLYFGLVGLKERDECELILMENGVNIDGSIQLNILIPWFDLELIM